MLTDTQKEEVFCCLVSQIMHGMTMNAVIIYYIFQRCVSWRHNAMQSQAHVHHDQVLYGLVGVVTTLHAEKMLTVQGQENVVVCLCYCVFTYILSRNPI